MTRKMGWVVNALSEAMYVKGVAESLRVGVVRPVDMEVEIPNNKNLTRPCLLYTSPSPRDA